MAVETNAEFEGRVWLPPAGRFGFACLADSAFDCARRLAPLRMTDLEAAFAPKDTSLPATGGYPVWSASHCRYAGRAAVSSTATISGTS